MVLSLYSVMQHIKIWACVPLEYFLLYYLHSTLYKGVNIGGKQSNLNLDKQGLKGL